MTLPHSLIQLEPFLSVLQALPADELNEDVDTDLLHELLRERVAGMSARQADAEIETIRSSLESWHLKSPPDNGAAVWLMAYLSYPRLGRELVRPVQPAETGPHFEFDVPDSWSENRVPFRLDLSLGNVFASMIAVDEMTFEIISRQNEHRGASSPVQATHTATDVSFGPCRGYKYVFAQAGDRNWKRVDYLLEVPGGFVMVQIGTERGDDFDESPIEERLDSLSLTHAG